jgi:hypothetical protein
MQNLVSGFKGGITEVFDNRMLRRKMHNKETPQFVLMKH